MPVRSPLIIPPMLPLHSKVVDYFNLLLTYSVMHILYIQGCGRKGKSKMKMEKSIKIKSKSGKRKTTTQNAKKNEKNGLKMVKMWSKRVKNVQKSEKNRKSHIYHDRQLPDYWLNIKDDMVLSGGIHGSI
jgi:hypothetical protein